MPLVRINTGIAGQDGKEGQITEYMCDSPDCGNVAGCVVGCVKELPLSMLFAKSMPQSSETGRRTRLYLMQTRHPRAVEADVAEGTIIALEPS